MKTAVGFQRVLLSDRPLTWMLPLAVVSLLVFVLPIIQIVGMSFTEATLYNPTSEFTLASYGRLFRDADFLSMVGVTLAFVIPSVVLQVVLGFAIALYIDSASERGLWGTMIVRTAVLAAWALPGVVAGVVWKIVFSELDSGLIMALTKMVIPSAQPQFLSSPLPSLISCIVANVWRGTAYSMILIYAGLKTFPRELYEAATIDRAGPLQILFKVTIPVLAPLLLICVLLITVQTFNTFDLLRALTAGGPGRSTEVIVLNIYRNIFIDYEYGRGAATAMVLLGINVLLTLLYFRFLTSKED